MARSYLPHGFRFHPTDEELLVHYLKKKVAGKARHDSVIGEIDIYKFEPTDLPGLAILCSRDPEWFFYNSQDKKYHGSRTNRTTKAGYWKATGKDRRVAVGSCIGMKKTLIYYVGRAPHGKRTDWVMHEYRLDEEVERNLNCPESFVLCRVRKKSGVGPRNGEQYGAPVLEEEDEEDEVPDVVDETCTLLCAVTPHESVVESTAQGSQILTTVTDGAMMETAKDVMSLQDSLAFDGLEQHHGQEGDFVADGLLSLLEDHCHFTHAGATHETTSTDTFGINSNSFLSGLFDAPESEAVILEDILHMVSGLEALPEHSSDMQEYPHNHTLCVNDWQRDGYIELADLDTSCDESSTVKSSEFNKLLNELEDDMEFQSSSTSVQDHRQVHQSLPPSGYREDTRELQDLGNGGMINELEVPPDSFECLSVVDSKDRRLLELDGVVPSDFPSSPDHEGAVVSVALNHSHATETYGQLEGLDNGSESSVSFNGEPVNSSLHPLILPNDRSNTVGSTAPGSSSPSSFRGLISGFLGKMEALPASAEELPSEQKRSFSKQKESCVCSSLDRKPRESVVTYFGSLGRKGNLVNFTGKLNPLQDEKQTARIPQFELQRAVDGDSHSVQHCRDTSKDLSRYLLCLATVVLIAFCAFRGFCGFCRYMRVALM